MFHLPRRFFGYVTSQPLSPDEVDDVRSQLSPELFDLFMTMNDADQRHAVEVATRTNDPTLTEAALLHDVGKSVSGIGAIGRSCATVLGALSVPVSGSWELYLRHGEVGAEMLEMAGAAPLTVAFARFHPGPTPPGVSEKAWLALEAADDL